MSNPLIEKIRKSREKNVSIDKFTFTTRRPNDLEMLEIIHAGDISQRDLLTRFVVDWQGITELDLFPGGTGAPVPFDKELFAEWIADHPQYWGQLSDAITSGYKQHQEQLDLDLGKRLGG